MNTKNALDYCVVQQDTSIKQRPIIKSVKRLTKDKEDEVDKAET